MRSFLFMLLMGIWAVGCAHQKDPYDGRLTEVEPQLVAGCAIVAVITENADAGDPFPYLATKNMIKRIKARAVQMRATHLVWLHQTKLTGTAEAYRCPAP